MRISKLMSAVGAVTFFTGFLVVCAQDNPDQAAARAALMKAVNAQPSPPASQTMAPAAATAPAEPAAAPATAPAKKPKAAKATPPAATKTPPASTPMAMSQAPGGASDTAAQAAARAALMQKMGELNVQQPLPANPSLAPIVMKPSGATAEQPQEAAQPVKKTVVTPAPVTPKPAKVKPVPATAAAPATTSAPSAGSSDLFTPVPPPSTPQTQAGAQPSVSGTAPAAKPAVPVAVPVATPSSQASSKENFAGKSLGFKPIEPPPPPVSAQKQAELQALLSRYMANQISPDEYQKERAAILAAP